MKREHDVKGELPSEYKKLEYIQSTGTQWIDTNVIDSNENDYEIQWCLANYNRNWELIFGATKESRDANWIWVGYGSNNRNLRIGRGATNSNLGYYPTSPAISYSDYTNIHTLATNGKNTSGYYVFDIDGNEYANASTGSGNYNTGTITVYLCSGNYGGTSYPSSICVFYFNVYKNNEMTNCFIPALRNSDNKPGLYDICGSICPLTGTPFYVNAGTGEFLYK